jgi:hypothetical protein
MQKTFRAGVVLSFSILMLLSAPRLCSQEAEEKRPMEKSAPDQKDQVHIFGQRCETSTCVTKVLYFSNLSQPTDLQDVVNTLRAIVEIARVQMILSSQVVVAKGTPEQLALAEKLADEIDKAKRRFGAVGYRLDFKVIESDSNKKPLSQVYSLVTEAHDSAKLSIGRQLPAQSQSETGPQSKQSPDALSGRSIECRILSETERTIDLHLDVAFDSSRVSEPSEGEKPGLTSRDGPAPMQVRVRDHITVELGKPTIISMLDDPDNERTFQIEVTGTRIKERQ